VGLPLTGHKFESIWVIMDRLSKSVHFIPVNTNYKVFRSLLGGNYTRPSELT
jgi:hypothetical protein